MIPAPARYARASPPAVIGSKKFTESYVLGEIVTQTLVAAGQCTKVNPAIAPATAGLIGCGVRATEAPELLGSPAMAQLVTRLRNGYDVVLFDSPPLAAGVDPLVVGTLTGHLVMVLRTGHSNREMTAAKLEVVHRFPVRLLGAVLNDVPDGMVYSYYSYYLPGYETGTEEPRAEPMVI